MKFFRTIFIFCAILVAIVVLWRVGQSSVSLHVVPSLQEYIASSTQSRISTSTDETISAWMASSTIINSLLSTTSIVTSTNSFKSYLEIDDNSIAPAPKPPKSIITARSTLDDGYLLTPNGVLRLLIARNPTTRERGLSGYEKLDDDQGMLFIFPRSENVGFWMKDMNFPLDIVWITTDRKIAGVTENISPKSYPAVFDSPGSVQFVLEINANKAKEMGLKKGITLKF